MKRHIHYIVLSGLTTAALLAAVAEANSPQYNPDKADTVKGTPRTSLNTTTNNPVDRTTGTTVNTARTSSEKVGPHVVITFDRGRTTLTANAKSRLKSVIDSARSQGEIDEIQAAVWSDKALPQEGQELTKFDRDLAKNRGKTIQNYLSEQLNVDSSDVVSYNMAERSSWLSKLFDTTDSEIKQTMDGDADPDVYRDGLRVFKESGEPSSAVILVRYKR